MNMEVHFHSNNYTFEQIQVQRMVKYQQIDTIVDLASLYKDGIVCKLD